MGKQVIVKSPGKIYIAGEYAVVEGGSAILFPIGRFVEVRLEEASENLLLSHKYRSKFSNLDLLQEEAEYKYIVNTLNWFNLYLEELGKSAIKYKVEIKSELDSNENKKYGFGSSAAIIIALLKALFIYHNLFFNNLILYKASVMIQSTISKYTSFGDLACIAYEDKVYYKKFDNKVFDLFNKLSISKILTIPWPNLVIEKVYIDFNFLIVHTGVEASSHMLVENVMKHKESEAFKRFFKRSEELVLDLKNGNNHALNIISELDSNLLSLDIFTNSKLFIPKMNEIRTIISKYNGSIKFSGAGGGDCVICFFDCVDNLDKAKEELISNDFEVITY